LPVYSVATFKEATADARGVGLRDVKHFVVKAKSLLNMGVSSHRQQES
jgi:hypothetical protein